MVKTDSRDCWCLSEAWLDARESAKCQNFLLFSFVVPNRYHYWRLQWLDPLSCTRSERELIWLCTESASELCHACNSAEMDTFSVVQLLRAWKRSSVAKTLKTFPYLQIFKCHMWLHIGSSHFGNWWTYVDSAIKSLMLWKLEAGQCQPWCALSRRALWQNLWPF